MDTSIGDDMSLVSVDPTALLAGAIRQSRGGGGVRLELGVGWVAFFRHSG